MLWIMEGNGKLCRTGLSDMAQSAWGAWDSLATHVANLILITALKPAINTSTYGQSYLLYLNSAVQVPDKFNIVAKVQ
jgi:hypothetical protein